MKAESVSVAAWAVHQSTSLLHVAPPVMTTVKLVPVRAPEQPRRRPRDWFVRSAGGLLLEEEGRVFAAVQLFGQPSRGSLGERVWMPKGLSARARLELAAIFTVLLARVRIRDV